MIDGGTNSRLTSIALQVPARGLTIGAAVGPAKVAAIRAALKGRLLNGLITDEATAGVDAIADAGRRRGHLPALRAGRVALVVS